MHTPTLPGLILSDLIAAVITTLGVDSTLQQMSEDQKAGHFPISLDRPLTIEHIKYIVAGYFTVKDIGNSLGYDDPEAIWGDVDIAGGIETLTVGLDLVVGQVQFSINPSY